MKIFEGGRGGAGYGKVGGYEHKKNNRSDQMLGLVRIKTV